jgi:quercetin dioxygenase-like cupin family protein
MYIKARRSPVRYHRDMAQSSLIAAESAVSLNLANEVQVSSAGIVSRTLVQTPELRSVLFAFDEGQELTPHTSRRRALIQILSGACEFLFNGDWHRLQSGALLHLPPGHLHAVRATAGAFTMLLTLAGEPAGISSET